MLKLSSFKRITTTGDFIPEIDGLRFIAIITVIFCHLSALIAITSVSHHGENAFTGVADFLLRGRYGVQLFFVISGIVLGIPFCRKRMRGEKDLHLRAYYLRRLTRIEPPYFIVMIVLFFASVYVAHTLDLPTAVKSLFCSLTYTHNFVYGRHIYPYLTTVAWSLEIEIQFYLLMPLLSFIFLIKDPLRRRALMIGLIIFFTFTGDLAQLPFLSLYEFIQYFLAGLLLADLYCHKEQIPKNKWLILSGYLAFAGMWLYDIGANLGVWIPFWHLLQLAFVFVFYYAVLFQNGFNWIKKELITVIGGMCYSIYLLHYPIISLTGNFLTQYSVTGNTPVDDIIFSVLIMALILSVSALFFILIERPCMDKNWPKKLMMKWKVKKPPIE